VILLVSFYVDPDSRRQAELLECLRRNSRNDLISEIHVFVEDPRGAGLAAIFTELADARIRLIAHERRATYSDLFTYANRHLAGWRVIIANADIYFDRSLARLDGYDLADRLLCLSRWDVQANGETHLFDFSASQDAWIFQAPLREFRADFHLGVLGCDNRLAWEAEHVGLTLSNPSRTIRANHLHLSEVRRYARQWLRGPTRAVTPEVLDNRWLWFVMPVLDGLGPMHQTLASLQSQPRSTCVLVDASGSDAVTEWAGEHAPNAVVVHVDSGSHPSVAELWNRGAAAADAVGVVGFLDATVTARDSLSQYVLEHVEPGIFLHRHGAAAFACTRSDFDRVHGFDPLFRDAAEACADLRSTMRPAGLAERRLPASLLSSGDNPRTATAAETRYRRAKSALRPHVDVSQLPGPVLREIHSAIGRQTPAALVPVASVVFREAMGYAVERLRTGVSSHTNITRPFVAIPQALDGLSFTQVVAYSVAPVEVEFVSPGRLYVLVGDDWDGQTVARTWLRDRGLREDLPSLRTEPGPGFEVWSLVGEVGDRFELPTQVMLVADRLERSPPPRPPAVTVGETIFALTSLSPSADAVAATRNAIRSWRSAGLAVRAFNHPSEIERLARVYDVEFVPVHETASTVFGRHVIPVNVMLDWATQQCAPVLLINSDITLDLAQWEMKRLRWLADGGLCYFIRYNHAGNPRNARREPYGIDAFLLHGRDAAYVSDSFLSMGEPFWDYWVPHVFASRNRPIASVEFPTAFHQQHQQRWSWDNWHRCALEFARATKEPAGDRSFEACLAMSLRVRQNFEARRTLLQRAPVTIRNWLQQTFSYRGPKTFLELGAHLGTDTQWLASLPDVTIYAFEPDPRNNQPPRPNVEMQRAAVADRDGRGSLILSQTGWGMPWTHSSSIKRPKNHLQRFPVTFGDTVEVELIALDTFRHHRALEQIDFIWADVQGAEAEMILGGRETLSRTRYLYTEFSDDEMYEQQPTLKHMLELLPDFRVVELWPDDVLLENRQLMLR